MKQIFKTLVLVAAAVATLTSCEKAPEVTPAAEEFTLTVNATLPAPDGTKTYLGDKVGDKYPVLWSEGDKIRLYEVSYATEGGTAEYSSGASESRNTYSSDIVRSNGNTEATFTGLTLANPVANADLFDYIAYYGNTSSMGMYRRYNPTPYVKMIVPNEQTIAVANQFDASAALMAAKQIGYATRQTTLDLNFKHLVAYGMLTITNLNCGAEKVQSVTFSNDNHNITGQSRYLYLSANDELTIDTSNVYKDVVVDLSALTIAPASFNVPFTIAPTTFAEGDKITIQVTTDAGKTYTRKITLTAEHADQFDFQQGKILEFSANFNGVEAEVVSTIADVLAGTNAEQYSVEGTIAAVTNKSFILVDATGALNIYTNALPKVGETVLKVGDNVTVKGTRGEYQNAVQLASPTVAMRDGASVSIPDAVVYDADKIDAYIGTPTIKRVELEGIYAVSGTYKNLLIDGVNVAAGGSFYQLPDAILGDIVSGTPVVVDGYLVGYNTGKYVNIHAISMEAVTTPYLVVLDTEYEVSSLGGDVDIAITTNVADVAAAVSGIAGATAVVAGNTVTVTVPANTSSEARTATVTLSGTGVSNVNVTITQNGASDAVVYELVTNVSDLAEYDEIILVAANDGVYYAPTNSISSNKLNAKQVVWKDDVVTLTDEDNDVDVFTLIKIEEGKWSLKSALQDAFVCWNDGTNFEFNASTGDNNDYWTITSNGFTCVGDSTRSMWYQISGNRFGPYSNKSGVGTGYVIPAIYKKVTE